MRKSKWKSSLSCFRNFLMVPIFFSFRLLRIQFFFHEYEVLNGRGFFCKWPTFSLDFWHEIFSYFFSCSIISSMYLYWKYDVYFCIFRSEKPILHDSKCEKLAPQHGRKQWNKLQTIKVRKFSNTIEKVHYNLFILFVYWVF